MLDRRAIRLNEEDLIAGAQVLAWVAMPHRPEVGVELLNQWYWARRNYRGESVPELPWSLKKRNRLESQLITFNARFLAGVRAGLWLQRKCWASLPGCDAGAIIGGLSRAGLSTRQLAARRASTRGTAQANEIRDIWSRRRPVAHLAWAAGEVLGALHAEENRDAFDLERTVFWPNWVQATLARSEEITLSAARFGAFDPSDFYRFHRDSY